MTYFDHNATTPVRPEVRAAMDDALARLHGNPSSAHAAGQAARAAVERARAQVAALVGAAPGAVVFTSGGTEGDHLALAGGARAIAAAGGPRRVAISAVEHHAVHGAAELLAEDGFAVTHVPVDRNGCVDPAAVDALPADTALLAVMLANNETGVLEPVVAIAARARARGIRVHCDAVQAAGKVPIDAAALGADYLVISGHKFGGPKGAGALVLADGAPLEALQRGSAQERGRRAGTENVPGIVGLGVAAECARRELAAESARLLALRERLERGIREAMPDAVVHAADAPRLPNTTSVSFPGARSDTLLIALDARGFEVSAGAACASGAVEPSAVMRAMGVPPAIATSALRLSTGRTTTAADVEALLAALVAVAGPAARRAGVA